MSGATIPGAPGQSSEQAYYWDGTQWVAGTNPSAQATAYWGRDNGGANANNTYTDTAGLPSFIHGRGGNDTLDGGAGNDIIIGGTGSDSLVGGAGADTLVGGDATVTGTLGSPVITTALDVSTVDTMAGGLGDDTYLVGNTLKTIVEVDGEGTDRVLLAGNITNYTLGSGVSVEAIGLQNPAQATGVRIAGNEFGQTITGGAGNDTLVGNGGDSLIGGLGNDLFTLSGNNTIVGGGGSDTVTFSTPGQYTVTGAAGNFTITGAGGTAIASEMEYLQTNGGTTDLIAGTYYVCFATGTRILTSTGEVEIERLQAGDLVATVVGKGAPMKPVLWVGRRRVVLAGNPAAEQLSPVRIRAGALGGNTPHRDLLVSPDHCLYLDDALVPARLLVNGSTITIERGLAEVTWYHVELESHDVLLAEGAAAESWLDCDNRGWFENASVAQIAIGGDLRAAGSGWDADRACAPLVHGGPRLAAIRDSIAAVATAPAPQAAAA